MCKVLAIGLRSYYRWKRSSTSKRELKKEKFKKLITEVYFEFKQRYGSPRITVELHSRGYKISRITVAKYMREMGLRSKLAKKFKATTDSKHNYQVVENVLDREFEPNKPSQAWVSDITYISVKEGFLFLTTVIDLYDRKLIGWSLSKSMATNLTTLPAWRMAIKNRKIAEGLIFHSDQGIQYANRAFANTLESYKVVRSMSRTGNCWDNSVAESFFKSLKTELIYGNTLLTREEMEREIFEYIELWYNKKRRHSYLNYMTIEEFNNRKINYEYAA
ncbi:Transposase InsO and inactivated derivatives [Arenibacter nanhaiticus]|uniref:Transposase InsO and inactivated derivatives n=3 Tax=Arenibacter TaxID=178469 RepID=A0A1M6LAR6_9FLAO|nr:Transposase InsO and inactivated derivatives [Arenibacter nanhaiticus]